MQTTVPVHPKLESDLCLKSVTVRFTDVHGCERKEVLTFSRLVFEPRIEGWDEHGRQIFIPLRAVEEITVYDETKHWEESRRSPLFVAHWLRAKWGELMRLTIA